MDKIGGEQRAEPSEGENLAVWCVYCMWIVLTPRSAYLFVSYLYRHATIPKLRLFCFASRLSVATMSLLFILLLLFIISCHRLLFMRWFSANWFASISSLSVLEYVLSVVVYAFVSPCFMCSLICPNSCRMVNTSLGISLCRCVVTMLGVFSTHAENPSMCVLSSFSTTE